MAIKKRFTIFSRLILSYFIIILVMGGVNAYTVVKLHQLNDEAIKIFNVDERMIDLKQKLADSILTQLGYEKKYAITKDPVFQSQFKSAEKDFDTYLGQAMPMADTPEKKDALSRVKSLHEQYEALIREEIEPTGTSHFSSFGMGYEKERERVVEQILEALKALESHSAADIYARMKLLQDAAGSALKLAVLMFAVAVALILGISFVSTRSITNPIRMLMEKTKEVSRGVFEGNLSISSPPEISQLAQAVNVMCDKLQKVDKMKSEFFAAVSHELRTPLTSIKQGMSLLGEGVGGPIPDKQERLFAIISEETNRLIDIVNRLLELSKMEAGMMSYDFRHETLPPLVQKVVVEMSPLVEAKKIKLQLTIEQEIPPLKLDRERMLQALRNLVGNAVKFTPEGGKIGISANHTDGSVMLSVQDTGPGIPKENLDAVFEKFRQLPIKNSEWVKGTGLGLAFVKYIITAHGGRVWAESEPGQGSTFIFVLPV
ncbi:MAG TPA: ATP-binding protein [Syntrophorhabdaceae bacterium]|nr:ATP-binding protein [Syntrophorhabdaceae bacterium]